MGCQFLVFRLTNWGDLQGVYKWGRGHRVDPLDEDSEPAGICTRFTG